MITAVSSVSPDPLTMALLYASRGWHVFPCYTRRDDGCSCGNAACGSPAKHPHSFLVPRGVTQATTDPDTIRDWWAAEPNANVAIATGARSGIVVLDVDPEHGGAASLRLLEAQYRELPATGRVITGSGGWHLYFLHPGGELRISNSAGRLGPGLDVRGEGGYVIAPPSVHISGGRYRWEAADAS